MSAPSKMLRKMMVIYGVPEPGMFSVSAQAAEMKYHRMDGLNKRHLFLTVLEAGKSQMKVLEDLVPGETHILAARWPLSLCVLTWQRAERSKVSGAVSYKGTNSIMGAPPS